MNEIKSTGPGNRVQWVDIARVIATLSVILQHVPRPCPANGPVLSASLALFFILSGFFLSPKFGSGIVPGYLARRSASLVKPYLFWSLSYALLMWANDALWHEGSPFPREGGVASTLSYWLGFGREPLLTPMWFVRDLIVFTVAASLISRMGALRLPLIACVGLTCLFLLNLTGGNQWPSPYMFGNFCLGIMLGGIPDLLQKWKELPRGIHMSIVAAYAVLLVLAASRWSGLLYSPLTPLGIAALCSLAVMMEHNPVGKWLASFGQATFFVFCFHIFVISFLIFIEEDFLPDWPAPIWWLMTPLIYAVSVLCYVAVRRYAPWLSKYVNSR